MNFNLSDVTCAPENEGRNFYGCLYKVGDKELFYERTWTPTGFLHRTHKDRTPATILHDAFSLLANPINSEQWVSGGLDKVTAESLAAKYGAKAREEYYCEGKYFLVFTDSDKALAFCRTEDFDRYDTRNAEVETFT